ncbi:MAG: dephospho-CoA kinase [Rhodobacteraceae bacterium]|nr:dephospho-CoA kinase [Paracoccaceae bacterium]
MKGHLFALGLTGSIGMGKSTAAEIFAGLGHPIWSADNAVEKLYSTGGEGVAAIAGFLPEAVPHRDGPVSKEILSQLLLGRPEMLQAVEKAIHPLVGRERQRFFDACRAAGKKLAIAEIPLLFETGAENGLDAVAVVSVPIYCQAARVMRRTGMSVQKFDAIRRRQMPDWEKRRRADYVIDASTRERAGTDIERIVADILRSLN